MSNQSEEGAHETVVRDKQSNDESLSLMKKLQSYKVSLRDIAAICILLTSCLVWLGFDSIQSVEERILKQYKEKLQETVEKETEIHAIRMIPEFYGRHISSFRVQEILREYVDTATVGSFNKSTEKYSSEELLDRRFDLMIDLGRYIDSRHGASELVRKTVKNNQLAFKSFIPFLIEDIRHSIDFQKSCHVSFWIISAYLEHSAIEITNDTIARELTVIGKENKTVVRHLFEKCQKTIRQEIAKAKSKDARKELEESEVDLPIAYKSIKTKMPNADR